jgi:hypothetical protein
MLQADLAVLGKVHHHMYSIPIRRTPASLPS